MGINDSDSSSSKLDLKLFQQIFETAEPGVTIDSLEEAQGSGRGDNYTAALYRILLKGYRTNQEGKRIKWEKSVICKRLPDSKARREAYRSEELFRNEVEFYNRILPDLLKYQQKKTNDVLRAIPHCYLARNDLVVLEDLRVRGFEMPNRQEGLTLDQTLAVLKELARFHSLSLSYKDQNPTEFNRLKSQVTEGIFTERNFDWYRNYYEILTKNAIDMVSQTLSPHSTYVEKLEKFVGNNSFFSNMVELVGRETPLATLCHGDCWTNNFLYKYDGNNDIAETCLVDFQLIRYGSPALDVSNLIFCCTDKLLRQNNMKTFLETYCKELVRSLRTLGPLPSFCSTEEQLWTQMQSEFQIYAKFGLGLAIDILPISTCTPEEAPDLYLVRKSGKEETNGAPELDVPPNEICRRKMTDIVIDLVDGGML
ncbi:uncharacterized protein LOC119074414 [Bradysia coprophila]|uniref:uncharacterized protein LOC119074414 n=1 Tax=Bradysia coprophila TaxID=38358 RepID=UPI00187D8AA3|nr:uncharacterized protein LOC119074414 [Bradysia coprophila]